MQIITMYKCYKLDCNKRERERERELGIGDVWFSKLNSYNKESIWPVDTFKNMYQNNLHDSMTSTRGKTFDPILTSSYLEIGKKRAMQNIVA